MSKWTSVALVALVLFAGVGGSLGAVALGDPDLAGLILSFASGLLAGGATPQLFGQSSRERHGLPTVEEVFRS